MLSGLYILFNSRGYASDYQRIFRQLNTYVGGERLEPPTRSRQTFEARSKLHHVNLELT